MTSLAEHLWFFALSSDYHRRVGCQCAWQDAAAKIGLPNLIGVGFDGADIADAAGYRRLVVGLFPRRPEADGPLDQAMPANDVFLRFQQAGYDADVDRIKDHASRQPNVRGVLLDDWSTSMVKLMHATADELSELAGRVHAPPRLDLWAVHYTDWEMGDLAWYLPAFDVISVWTWFPENLPAVESHFDRIRRAAPAIRVNAGIFMFDHAHRRSMPLDTMAWQFDRAFRWLETGAVESITFLGSDWLAPKHDYPAVFESIKWTRGRLCEMP